MDSKWPAESEQPNMWGKRKQQASCEHGDGTKHWASVKTIHSKESPKRGKLPIVLPCSASAKTPQQFEMNY